MRCRHRRWRGLAVPDDAVWLPFAEPERARPVPSVRYRTRRHLDRRGRRVRAAGTAPSRLRPDGDDAILLLGVGESNDAYHMSSPHPEGAGARLAMERALAAQDLRPSDIDYINLHGTATRVGDTAEDIAVFGVVRQRNAAQFHQGSHRPYARRGRHRRGDHLRSGDPARPAARQSAYRNDRSGIPRPLSTRYQAGADRSRAEQFLRLRRQQLQPGPGTATMIRVFIEGIGIARSRAGRLAGGAAGAGGRGAIRAEAVRAEAICSLLPPAERRRAGATVRLAIGVGAEALAHARPRPGRDGDGVRLFGRRRRDGARNPVRARDGAARGVADPVPQLGAQRAGRVLVGRHRLARAQHQPVRLRRQFRCRTAGCRGAGVRAGSARHPDRLRCAVSGATACCAADRCGVQRCIGSGAGRTERALAALALAITDSGGGRQRAMAEPDWNGCASAIRRRAGCRCWPRSRAAAGTIRLGEIDIDGDHRL